ncbi:MAG: hypothetical protein AAF525_16990, partial [Pseudomonadota bacterium]
MPMFDDGLQKDIVFRAGALSTPRISAYITEHFVPVCLAYKLATNNSTSNTAATAGWGTRRSLEG